MGRCVQGDLESEFSRDLGSGAVVSLAARSGVRGSRPRSRENRLGELLLEPAERRQSA
jgi:hypothetical protein